MKNIFRSVTVAIVLLLMTAPAYSAELVYFPSQADLKIEPGSTDSVDIQSYLVDSNGDRIERSSFFFIFFIGDIAGDMPEQWISAYPTKSWRLPASTSITINVPETAEPGQYTALISAAAMGGGHDIDSATVSITVDVAGGCAESPEVDILGVEPQVLWPPNNKTVELTVFGSVTFGDGCESGEVLYTVDDEYGEFSGSGTLDLDAEGSFTSTIDLEASRRGSDKDGREYEISVSATDKEGNETVSDPKIVTVPHDMR